MESLDPGRWFFVRYFTGGDWRTTLLHRAGFDWPLVVATNGKSVDLDWEQRGGGRRIISGPKVTNMLAQEVWQTGSHLSADVIQ